MAATKISIKLLVDKINNRVIFAEAEKDFVDFLFSLLSLPLASIIGLLTKKKMVGCLGNLFGSVEKLSNTYVQPNQHKDTVLKPKLAATSTISAHVPLLVLPKEKASTRALYMTDVEGTQCPFPNCGNKMSTLMTYVIPSEKSNLASICEGGFVKDEVTYMVMDDLVVTPMSMISSVTLLNKFNVLNVACLEERVVNVGTEEGLELLRASMQSNTVLSNVFLQRSACSPN
ncbi:hypothetical protein GIB67_033403 [Kingdonia uniflora]|uniref:Uncharacterized protein n=1 Tax=Kingdonia uniflora TaxID=39325 RepID=A0A7J7LU25_9MAGN|nr:hypothetical protein GIB67_033403 [Kingdonia uniflora]